MANDMTQEQRDMYEKLFRLQGARIRFDCDGAIYQGIIGKFRIPTCQFLLEHASIVGHEYIGTLKFRYHEVKNMTVLESPQQAQKYKRNDYLLNILKNKPVHEQKYDIAKIVCNLSDDSDDESSVSDDEVKEQFVLDVPCYLKSKLPTESVLLDFLDLRYEEAIRDIFQEKVVGVSFEGEAVSRFGKLSFITVATRTCVYVFDIESLTGAAFDRGLRDLLEDPHILKVVHDSRFPADCLCHVYHTELENVFDTQVADFVAAMQVYDDKYNYDFVCNYEGLLMHHLDLPPEYVYKRVKGLSDSEQKELFSKRPISNEYQYDLTKNALYLLLLHEDLSKKLMRPLRKYSTAYRDLISTECTSLVEFLGCDLSSPDCIPSSLLMNGIQTTKFVTPVNKKLPPLLVNYVHPKTGKTIVIKEDDDASVETTNEPVNRNWPENKSKSSSDNKLCVPSSELPSNPVETISLGPSGRHMDEVFHRLANNKNSRSLNAYTVNVMPDYVSKCTMRMPFEGYSDKVSNEVEVPKSIVSSDIWAKIRAEDEASRAALPNAEKRKITFRPA